MPNGRRAVSEAAHALLDGLGALAARDGRVTINRVQAATVCDVTPDQVDGLLEELNKHGDILIDCERGDLWWLTVLRECGPA
jgi:hypothetical protein